MNISAHPPSAACEFPPDNDSPRSVANGIRQIPALNSARRTGLCATTAWLLFLALHLLAAHSTARDYSAERMDMLEAIRTSVRDTAAYTGITTLRPDVMDAMATVPREAFVPNTQRHNAYLNTPLPIGEGQTISQPLIVALMTELLDTEAGDVVLEVGTGSGYQAAVLGQLVDTVYSVEIIPALAASAAEALRAQGYDNVTVRAGDGYAGWTEHAPFDGIIVTAAAPQVPPPLLEQLKPGGRLVIPLGEHNGYQELILIEKDKHGALKRRSVLPVRFVPLTGDR